MDKKQQLTETLTQFICLVAKTLPDDVLDALEKLLDSSQTLLISAPGWMDYIAAIEYARTAIAKAKGEP